MPPKAKYTREEIIQIAIQVIVEQGIEHLTARELAKALNTSVKPIFTAFTNMEEVKQEAFNYAFMMYHKQFEQKCEVTELFRNVGIGYVNFAIKEPKLFQLLFMKFQEEKSSFAVFMRKLDNHYGDTIQYLQDVFQLTPEQGDKMYSNMWIFCHGMATLCATNQCTFTDEEIKQQLDFAFESFYKQIKAK